MRKEQILKLDRPDFYKRIFTAVFQNKSMSGENARLLQDEYEKNYYLLRPRENKDLSVQEAIDIFKK